MSASYESAIEVQCWNNGVGKRAYTSSGDAKRAARHTMTNGGRAISTYRCPHCGKFHTGRPTAWRKRQARLV